MHGEYHDAKMGNKTYYTTVSANLHIIMAWGANKHAMRPAGKERLSELLDGIN